MQRDLGIGVNATMRGNGLTQAAAEIRQLEKSAGQLARELVQANNRVSELNDEIRALDYHSEGYQETVKKLEKELFKTSIELGKLQAQAKKAGLDTERLTEASEQYQRELRQIREGVTAVEPAMERLEQTTSDLQKETKEARQETDSLGQELKKLDSAQDTAESSAVDLRQALAKSTKEFESAKAETIALKVAYIKLRDSGKGTAEQFKGLSKQIEAAQQVEMKAIQRTRDLIKKIESAGDNTDEFSQSLKNLKKNLQHAEGKINGNTNKVKELGKGFDKTGEKIDKTNSRLQTLITKGPHIQAMGNLISDGIKNAARAIYDFGKESYKASLDFDRQAREIFTLMPGASGKMRDALKRDVLAMGTELGRLPDEMLPAVYNALSAGIPEDNVLDTVRTASKAARAGVAELDTTLKLGVAILNAQVTGVSNINDVYDQLFFTIKNGVITMPELTDVMSQVTSVAGEAGVSMQDISAAMIVMTRQGDSAAEASELLSIMLMQLSTSGTTLATVFEQAAGQSFRTFIAEGGTLAGAMELLQKHAEDTGTALGDMMGGGSPFFRDTQAARGALELTGKHLQDMVQFSNEAEEAMGSMAAASAEMGEAAELSTLQYSAALAELKINLGELASVKLTPLIEDATALISVWSGSKAGQVEKQVDGLIESTGSYVEVGHRLNKVLQENDNFLGRVTGGYGAVEQQMKRVIVEGANFNGTNEEIAASIEKLTGATVTLEGREVLINGRFLDTIESLKEANLGYEKQTSLVAANSEAIAQSDAKLLQYNNTRKAEGWEIDQLNEQMERQIALRRRVAEAINTYDVQEVLDGDTVRIELEGEIKDIRFRNINAPEIQHGDKAAMPWAIEAMDAAEAYFDKNPFKMEGEIDRESYDRIIASVPELEQQLVEKGLAIPLPVELTEDPERFEELKALAMEAAAAGVGMFEDQALAARVLSGEMVDLGQYYEELTEAAKAELEVLQETQKTFGNYVLQASNAADAQTNWTDELFKSATAQGISQEQIVLLAAATGEYSESQIEAMLKTAAMRVAVEELAGSLAAGDITVAEAIQSMQDFEAQLDQEYTAEFDYSDLEDAEKAAMDAETALREAAGTYTAEFVTKYRTEGTPGAPPPTANNAGGGDQPYAKYSGGRFRPGEWLLVGDGPGGQILPTTELVVFDKPGQIFSGRETNAMLNAPPVLPAGTEFNEFTGGEKTAVEIKVYITAENGVNAQEIAETIKDPLMDAAREAGLI